MSTQVLPELSQNTRILTTSAKETRRAFVDNQAKVRRIDNAAQTAFLERWKGIYNSKVSHISKDYQRLVGTSETGATELAATIRHYVTVQSKSPTINDDLIQELGTLNKRLPSLELDQTTSFTALQASLTTLGEDIATAMDSGDSENQSRLSAVQSEVMTLQRQLQDLQKSRRDQEERKRKTTTFTSLFTRYLSEPGQNTQQDRGILAASEAAIRFRAGGINNQERQLQSELEVARARLNQSGPAVDDRTREAAETALAAVRGIQSNLKTMREHLRSMFSETVAKLSTELQNHLSALQNYKANPSQTLRTFPTRRISWLSAMPNNDSHHPL
ncbi:hypothetical protein BD311DRAFT_664234 [Dichomitus squalens]|uniref:Uncharacterized protein n=1 Tax=Dichomitus squalens TaxID=114155 RepID=A0A4Q9MK63_9APHY|nr:hypothetical protein BD311DRAFT_664234 [Dichomitus squalens]